MSRNYSLNEKCFTQSYRENQNTYFMLSNFSSWNHAVYGIVWKYMVKQTVQKWIYNKALVHWMLDNEDYRHTFTKCNTYCCPTTRVVVQTRLNITFILHCLSFILVINQLDAQNLFNNKFISCLYTFRAQCAHRQEVKIVLYSLWYHHTYRPQLWPPDDEHMVLETCRGKK